MPKRKTNDEGGGRTFQKRWTEEYFFAEFDGKPICLICNVAVSAMKDFNVRRHYETKHRAKYAELTGQERTNKVQNLMGAIEAQRNVFQKVRRKCDSAVEASYLISKEIACSAKPFSEGEFVKKCMLKAADAVCPEKKECFANISLTRNTVAERITDMAKDIKSQLSEKASGFRAYSVALDESTDVVDTAQLAIFVRGVTQDLSVFEELLCIASMDNTTTGNDIFHKLDEALQSAGLPWEKLAGVTTDGAPAMTGRKNGLAGKVRERCKALNTDEPIFLHCIIHQESLCGKVAELGDVMNTVVKCVNLICSRALQHRQFRALLAEMSSQYDDIQYYSQVRWLSRGTVLKQFFNMREIIQNFMSEKGKGLTELDDPHWQMDLAFLVDLTEQMNILNKKLQGPKQVVTKMEAEVRAFKAKLRLWKKQMDAGTFNHFPSCQEVFDVHKDAFQDDLFKRYSAKLSALLEEFERRFLDFQSHQELFKLFANPFTVDVMTVPVDLQMEIIDLQSKDSLREKHSAMELQDFFQNIPTADFPKLTKLFAKILSLFGSTYICERLFSTMNVNKSKYRSRLTDEHLSAILQVATAMDISPDITKLVREKNCQVSGQKL